MKESAGSEAREGRSAAVHAGGFSIVELLVVVSLGAILVATVLPALNTAQDTLKAAVCLGNMHQWGLAISLYNDDQRDYYPYDGEPNGVCGGFNSSAWFNVLPPYINQTRLCDLYNANTPPTPRTKGIWTCPSAVSTNISPTMGTPLFMYSISSCLHEEGMTHVGFRRGRMAKPATTIIFCEEPEDNFPDVNGKYETAQRHFGGSNFVMGDSHAEWISFTNFCRNGNAGCPSPLGNIPWDDSSGGGDWKTNVVYHWWFFRNANTSSN
jgi:type II secretory pathway pseudopilin PulG